MSTDAGPGSKVGAGAVEALRDVLADGQLIAVGGFGLCGIPVDLIEAVRDSGVRDLTVVSNNMGVDGKGLGVLLETGQVRKVLASYVGENKLFAAQYLAGQPSGVQTQGRWPTAAGRREDHAFDTATVSAPYRRVTARRLDGGHTCWSRDRPTGHGERYRSAPDGTCSPVVARTSTVVARRQGHGREAERSWTGGRSTRTGHTPGVYVDTVARPSKAKEIEKLVLER